MKSFTVTFKFLEDSKRWNAQMLEYDIYADGETLEKAMENMSLAIAAEEEFCKRNEIVMEKFYGESVESV